MCALMSLMVNLLLLARVANFNLYSGLFGVPRHRPLEK
jgi:hypothetical protein